jgi:hypothetical protein
MKKLYLAISLSLLILVSSCDSLYKLTPGYWKWRSEFKKELEFVQKIIDNPHQMVEIIENSEFYNPEYMQGAFPESYPIHFIQNVENLEISDFYKVELNYYRFNHLVQNMLAIDVKRKCHSDYDQYISFAFATIHGKVILIDIGHFNGF